MFKRGSIVFDKRGSIVFDTIYLPHLSCTFPSFFHQLSFHHLQHYFSCSYPVEKIENSYKYNIYDTFGHDQEGSIVFNNV